ncbi:hypothetical protein D3C86_918730 [compost metagenome]
MPETIFTIDHLVDAVVVKRTPEAIIEIVCVAARVVGCVQEDVVSNEIGRQEGLPARVQRFEDDLRVVAIFKFDHHQLQRRPKSLVDREDALVLQLALCASTSHKLTNAITKIEIGRGKTRRAHSVDNAERLTKRLRRPRTQNLSENRSISIRRPDLERSL